MLPPIEKITLTNLSAPVTKDVKNACRGSSRTSATPSACTQHSATGSGRVRKPNGPAGGLELSPCGPAAGVHSNNSHRWVDFWPAPTPQGNLTFARIPVYTVLCPSSRRDFSWLTGWRKIGVDEPTDVVDRGFMATLHDSQHSQIGYPSFYFGNASAHSAAEGRADGPAAIRGTRARTAMPSRTCVSPIRQTHEIGGAAEAFIHDGKL